MTKEEKKTIRQIWLVTLALGVLSLIGYFFVDKGAGMAGLVISAFVIFMNALVIFGARTKREYDGGNNGSPPGQ